MVKMAWQAAISIVIMYYSLQLPFLLAVQSHRSQDSSDYLKLVHNADDFTPRKKYDYIVVGGGTAGCPLAATLSEKFSVLLLERGSIPRPNLLRQENVLTNVLDTNDKDSPSQAFIPEDGIPNARGRVLGGSSMINFGFYSRAEDEFYAESGLDWDRDVVDKAYQWVEETVAFRPSRIDDWQSSVKEAFVEAGLGPDNGYTLNHVLGAKITASTFDGNGTRHGSVEHLNRGKPNNLHVIVNATVEKVIFSSPRTSGMSAIGVIYRDSKGKSFRVRVRNNGEVILSAGAIGSPQLLLLSGVGPKKDLSSLNIRVVQNQPFVGKNMIDNPRNAIIIVSPFLFNGSGVNVVGITNDSYILALLSVTPFFSPTSATILFPRLSASPLLNLTSLVIAEKLARPLSFGSLRLATATNSSVNPIVRFNYFDNPRDLNSCVNAIQNIGEMLRTSTMEQYKFEDRSLGEKYFQYVGYPLPQDLNNVTAMEEVCMKTLSTMYHFHGGCVAQKVVDRHFKVIGIQALRIVDTSVFTMSPGTNPQATVMMMGRYVGLKIQEQRFAKGTQS